MVENIAFNDLIKGYRRPPELKWLAYLECPYQFEEC